MEKPRETDRIAMDAQASFWNYWNSTYREKSRKLPDVNRRQADMVHQWLQGMYRHDMDIIEIGCGSGWLCERLLSFGRVTGTDLSNEVLERSESFIRNVRFVPGNFFELDFATASFDVAVSLEVLAHVADQQAFLRKAAEILRPGGYLMLATQNKFALERWTQVTPRHPGQIRQWVNASTLRRLLDERFEVCELTSIVPVGDRGILRWTNAPKLMRMLSLLVPREKVELLKERAFLGHTLMALAKKRDVGA